MPRQNNIQFRKGTASQWNNNNPILASGEPGYDLTNSIFKIGDGVHSWTELTSLSNRTIRGSFLLNAPSGSFTVSGGYSVGSLDVFMNGVKLSLSGDYIANDGLSFSLSETAPSGSLIEYLALSPGLSFNSSNISDFNSSVSGILPVKNIIAGTNITVNNDNGTFTINSTATGGGTTVSNSRGWFLS
jgi:hypothetical protein